MISVRHLLYGACLLAALPSVTVQAAAPSDERGANAMEIVFTVDDQSITASIDDTAAGRAFVDMLPLELELTDYGNGTEKVADLPGSLPGDDAPAGYQPGVGDITLFAPWGNLAIFRKDFGYARGLVKLGRFTASFDAIDRDGPVPVRISRASP
ncbi:cyclophilin-like fold protein [Kushneria aurantia]|uniref:Cyclophilin-like fold protein n=1 Tax=Kushneria aurantia TaxID=504092 RepID=A0ABV6G0X7_9GAMM|nr:cyclophilin-like fold protein [Kushneria aurantia]